MSCRENHPYCASRQPIPSRRDNRLEWDGGTITGSHTGHMPVDFPLWTDVWRCRVRARGDSDSRSEPHSDSRAGKGRNRSFRRVA
jgi:hypothetical protein